MMRRVLPFVLCLAAGCSSTAPPVKEESVAAPSRNEGVVATAALKPRKLDPQDAWFTAAPRLAQADRETMEALDARMNAIHEYLEERKPGAKAFAESVLSLEAKAYYAGGVIEQGVGALAQAFGAQGPSQDSFKLYVRDRYLKDVIDPAELQKVVDAAIDGYAHDVSAVESQLLVDLRVDLADGALELPIPSFNAKRLLIYACTEATDKAVASAGTDILTALGTTVVSQVVGDLAADRMVSPDVSRLEKTAAGIYIGTKVDGVIDGVLAKAGYDPLAKVAAIAAESIDAACQDLILSTEELRIAYPGLFQFAYLHPNEDVRRACSNAIRAVETSPDLGLRDRLLKFQFERSRQRFLALRALVFRAQSDAPDETQYFDAKQLPPSDEIIRRANDITTRFGG